VIEKINLSFPNAKLTNIYASTELGSVLVSENNVFSISKLNASFIKIINGQLHVHRNLAAQFDNDFTADWYDTGDLVEWVDEEKGLFKFLSRKSEMINTGGYKVNPGEVEEVILGHPEVVAAKVFGKPNAVLGTILIAEVQLKEQSITTEQEIKTFLNTHLQAFKIPRMIKIVDQLSITRTGKISRKLEV
jgi:acyl-CoA synthetase (AMP-forming)/AMP-acid ligase II